MYYLFDEITLLLVLGGPAVAVFVVFAIILWKNPEAREWIKLWAKGGVMIHDTNDAGQYMPKRARAYAEGQFMAGKDKFGKREIYQVPKINNPFITKRFVSSGIHRPNFFSYSGKTVAVNAETLAAIEVAESEKKELPNSIREWAKSQNIPVPKFEEVIEQMQTPDGPKEVKRKVQVGEILRSLFTLDPRKIRYYFSEHYDEGPYDALLERKWQQGYQAGRSGRGMENTFVAVLFGAVLGGLVVLILVLMEVI